MVNARDHYEESHGGFGLSEIIGFLLSLPLLFICGGCVVVIFEVLGLSGSFLENHPWIFIFLFWMATGITGMILAYALGLLWVVLRALCIFVFTALRALCVFVLIKLHVFSEDCSIPN
jgi:hypothetical protein